MESDGEIQMQHAEMDGTVAAAAQAAQQNFLQANAPQADEASADPASQEVKPKQANQGVSK
jgi:hypothetical protein